MEKDAPDGGAYIDILDSMMVIKQAGWDSRPPFIANRPDSLVFLIQICLASLYLDHDFVVDKIHHFDLSRSQVYGDHRLQPIFAGACKQYINVRWILSIINFFAFHLKQESEGALVDDYCQLPRRHKTQPWLGKIEDGTKAIGKHWKGAYSKQSPHTCCTSECTDQKAYMDSHDLHEFRHKNDHLTVDNWEPLQDIAVFFDEGAFSSKEWPRGFENLNETDPYKKDPQLASQLRIKGHTYPVKSFYGTCQTDSTHYFGRIHGLPPQQGIPGFQRISFLRFTPSSDGDEVFVPEQIWGYEGCVLPGGRIIVGRWWWITAAEQDPSDRYSGPFIWWNIDESAVDPPIDPNHTLRFLAALKTQGFVI